MFLRTGFSFGIINIWSNSILRLLHIPMDSSLLLLADDRTNTSFVVATVLLSVKTQLTVQTEPLVNTDPASDVMFMHIGKDL